MCLLVQAHCNISCIILLCMFDLNSSYPYPNCRKNNDKCYLLSICKSIKTSDSEIWFIYIINISKEIVSFTSNDL